MMGRRGTSLAGYGAGFLLMGALMAILSRTRAGVTLGLALLGGAVAFWLLSAGRRKRLELRVSGSGIAWTISGAPGGEMAWRDIGAVAIRESPASGEEATAMFVVPREPGAGPGLILSVREMGRTTDEGVRNLREAAQRIVPHLPPDAIIDRGTRMSLMRWGVKMSGPVKP